MKNYKKAKSLFLKIGAAAMCLVMMVCFAACGTAGEPGATGPQGEQGLPGANGESAYIGPNGNWWVGNIDTGVLANTINPPEVVERFVAARKEVTGPQDANGRFTPDQKTLKETYEASVKTAEQVGEEGFVLLKNANNTLPMKAKNVTLLGVATEYELSGGGGSGSGAPESYGIKKVQLKDGLKNGGFNVNPHTGNFYRDNYTSSSLEPGPDVLESVEGSYSTFNDAAILMFKRAGTEGKDKKLSDVDGHADKTEHYLELDDNEEALIKYAKKQFKKVIVLINSSDVMELGDLAAEKTDTNLGVDAIMQVGIMGNNGLARIGAVLSGKVSPSGHTVDTWTYDFTKDPTYKNFGDMKQNGTGYDNNVYVGDAAQSGNTWLEYREGIYLGYKYYETKHHDMNSATAGSGDAWYNSSVLYPFGYGLSYTTFDWKLGSVKTTGKITAANQTVTMQVIVTNTGAIAGRDVVQVYVTPPYTTGGIEKAHVNLMGFGKTRLLQPGESDVVTVEFVAQDAASFDWDDRNGNGFKGYELEAGDYVISARRNSHEEVLNITRTVGKTIKCDTDYTTGKKITPVFSQDEGQWAFYNSTTETLLENLMSRATGLEVPEAATKADRTVEQSFIDEVKDYNAQWSAEDGEHDYDYSYVDAVPESWKQYDGEMTWTYEPGRPSRGFAYLATRVDGSKTEIQLKDMVGVNYQDYQVVGNKVVVGTDEGSKKWEKFLNQLSFEEMIQIITNADFVRPRVESIGLWENTDADGPAQLTCTWAGTKNTGTSTLWPTAVSLASTWNTDLLYEMGRAMGNEALFLNYNGWYGPAMNIHRSPFSGRNFEYYSEDGVLSGKMAEATVRGATDKGLITYLKHLVLNDQETSRSSLYTWATEQTIREIYLKPFEMAIKTGGSMGTMAAMNRIGRSICYINGALHDGVLRNEWNFRGITLTDGWVGSKEVNAQLRSGVDLPLGTACFAKAGIEAFVWNKAENMVYVNPNVVAGGGVNYTSASSGPGAGGAPTGSAEYATNAGIMIADSKNHVIGFNDKYKAEDFTEASPTYYYVVRRAAMHILWVIANSNGLYNGFGDVDLEYTSTAGGDRHTSICVKPFGDIVLEDIKVLNKNLPDGWSLDTDLAVLSGTTNVAAGTYTIEISCLADGWIGNENKFFYNGKLYERGERITVTITITIKEAA